jgi:elongation factor 1-alpha
MTIDCTARKFITERYDFTLVDSPGDHKFMENFVAEASQSDVGLLVVPAASGEHEEEIGVIKSILENIIITFAMGIKQIIVLMNKMDETE